MKKKYERFIGKKVAIVAWFTTNVKDCRLYNAEALVDRDGGVFYKNLELTPDLLDKLDKLPEGSQEFGGAEYILQVPVKASAEAIKNLNIQSLLN